MTTQNTEIKYMKGVGEKRALLLNKLGIFTIGDLIRFYPRGYEDWSSPLKLEDAPYGETVCVRARIITAIAEDFKRPGMTLYKFTAEDDSGQLSVTLFNTKYLAARLHTGSEYLFYGKVGGSFIEREMSSPEISEVGAMGIRPLYHATGGLSSKIIERLVRTALTYGTGEDPLPMPLRERLGLCELKYALDNIHFPKTAEACERAKRRLVFEELFILQTGLLLLKGRSRATPGSRLQANCRDEFEKLLKFPLTGAQKRVIDECMDDMKSGRLMNRLLQGDVGSGKTAVAAALCYATVKNGFQSALMAPTEILAEQHFATLTAMLSSTGIKCGLLTGSLKKRDKDSLKDNLKNGGIDIIIGTHALLSENVEFDRLGLVITDEQHRFGVSQRAALAGKGVNPHTLVMSATPIPRTLALIIYGDLDISIIDEFPKGRQTIESYCVDSGYRERVYKYIKKHLDAGRQGYIVCPVVEENAESGLTSAQEYYERLRDGAFRDYSLGLLHGKMKARDKDNVMRSFKNGAIQLLISTTVIEVGIDVPNAVIMVIEDAERFGLSQLHQLRGRIGRGKHASTCIFISDSSGDTVKQRLQVICKNTDGFKIADEDLKLRGPGDFLGNRQHGLPDLKIADISSDLEVLRSAGQEAAALIKSDSRLENPENIPLKKEITEMYKKLNEN